MARWPATTVRAGRLLPPSVAVGSRLRLLSAAGFDPLYLGSAWYDRMLTSHVTKKVRKHIAASTAKKD